MFRRAALLALALSTLFIFPTSFAASPHPLDQKINARCAAKWGDNYRMQRYCRDRQEKAAFWVYKWVKKYGVDKPKPVTFRHKIFRHCAAEWDDQYGANWPMLKYCIQTQEKAHKTLHTDPANIRMATERGCRCGKSYISSSLVCHKTPCYCPKCDSSGCQIEKDN